MKRTTFYFASLLGLATARSPRPAVQVGQHVIFSYPGATPPEHLFHLISEGKVGGIILFGENVDDNLPNVIERFLTTYEESPAYLGTPLLIMTDQEGGTVRRLPGAPEQSAKEVGASEDPVALAAETGEQAAAELIKYNMNTNLAPVLDVYREAGNFIDEFGRSYSNDSAVVAELSSQFIAHQEGANVLATAKHFPGLGAASAGANTDETPVTIDLPLEAIRSIDELPYYDAIAADVAMIMTSWAIYPALDAERPAGMSEAWVKDELRGRLGYKGVIITDAIEAGSLKAFGNDGERGLLAKQAGVDILLASGRNVTQGEAVVDALVAALASGGLSQEELDASSERVQRVRERLA
ncbi:putative glycosyl hydrolase [Aspergillus lucknowensis]|uniref:Glycoside hydrolase superfamily n=1 Tax=Aspergillus lucknowensis TaxID=176173 RepID=A0ABR4LL50_9EURO